MSISNKSIQEVRDRADIVSVVQETVNITKKGSSLSGLCPFHNEKSPSFHVRPDSNYYHCFGCGESGDSLSFIMKIKGLSFPDAIEYLANKFSITLQFEKNYNSNTKKYNSINKARIYQLNKVVSNYFQSLLIKRCKEDETLLEYVKSRGLNSELVKEFSIGYSDSSWDDLTNFLKSKGFEEEEILNAGVAKRNSSGKLYDIMRGRLIFPISLDEDRFVAFGGRVIPANSKDDEPKYINSPETVVYQKQKVFYGLPQANDSIRKEKYAFLVEGYMDVIGFSSAGIKNVLATCGTALTSEHAKKIRYLCDKIVIVFDGDSAGRKAAGKAFEIFLNSKVNVEIVFLDEGEDPDSFTKKYKKDSLFEINKMIKHSALACFIKSEIASIGVTSFSDLTPVNKGKIAEKLARVLGRVTNNIERTELEKESQLLLQINSSSLSSQIEVEKKKSSNLTNIANEKEQIDKTFNSLSNFEQELLYHIMFYRHKLTSLVIECPVFCQHLTTDTLIFCQEINKIYIETSSVKDDDDYKLRVKEFLESLGSSWLRAWKKAYQMHDNKKLKTMSPNDLFQSYEMMLERKNVLILLDFARNQLLQCDNEDQQLEITQKIVALSKKLSDLKTPKINVST